MLHDPQMCQKNAVKSCDVKKIHTRISSGWVGLTTKPRKWAFGLCINLSRKAILLLASIGTIGLIVLEHTGDDFEEKWFVKVWNPLMECFSRGRTNRYEIIRVGATSGLNVLVLSFRNCSVSFIAPMRTKSRSGVRTSVTDVAEMWAWLRIALRHWAPRVTKLTFFFLTLDVFNLIL